MSNAKSTRPASTPYGANDHLHVVRFRPHYSRKVQALILVWRWLFELAILAVLTAFVVRLHMNGLAWKWSILAVIAAVTVPLLIPTYRLLVVSIGWSAVTRHRLRTYFVECRIFNRSGRLPWLLLTRPTPVGERTWIWLMPGLSILDFDNQAEQIAAACWARTARVERHKSVGSLVCLDVVRRDPLTASAFLPSTLIPAAVKDGVKGWGKGKETSAAEESRTSPLDVPRTVINLTAHVKADAKGTRNGSGRKRPTESTGTDGKPATQPTPPQGSSTGPVTRGGEDVSDYV